MDLNEKNKYELFFKNKQFIFVRCFVSLINGCFGLVIFGALYMVVRKSGFVLPVIFAALAMATCFFLLSSLGLERVIRRLAYDKQFKRFYMIIGLIAMITVAVCIPFLRQLQH